jgi:hypothetical protein
MNVPLQTCPVPPRPHWTEPVSREETLARREKFRKIGWLPPNFKPKTKKAIATAKRLWDRYVICACRLCLRGVTERTADDVLSGIMDIGVDADSHLLEGQHHDFESWIDWIHRTTKKRRTIVLVYTGSGCAKPTASWLSSLWTASPPNKCEGYGVSRSINSQ